MRSMKEQMPLFSAAVGTLLLTLERSAGRIRISSKWFVSMAYSVRFIPISIVWLARGWEVVGSLQPRDIMAS